MKQTENMSKLGKNLNVLENINEYWKIDTNMKTISDIKTSNTHNKTINKYNLYKYWKTNQQIWKTFKKYEKLELSMEYKKTKMDLLVVN